MKTKDLTTFLYQGQGIWFLITKNNAGYPLHSPTELIQCDFLSLKFKFDIYIFYFLLLLRPSILQLFQDNLKMDAKK